MDLNLAFPEQLSVHLRSLRKAQGMTQAQLAARMGVVQSRIAALEKDATKLTAEQLLRLLAALNASVVLRMKDIEPPAAPSRLRAKPTKSDAGGQW